MDAFSELLEKYKDFDMSTAAESIKDDMTALPPGKRREDKFICHSAFCRVTFLI